VLERVVALREQKVIRQISAIFDSRRLGYRGMLVAARTPVEGVVVFTCAHIADVSTSSVPALEGLPAIVDRLVGAPTDPLRVAV